MAERPFSSGFCGGAFGDEGKGKLVDAQVDEYLSLGKKVFVYRDNGGANAGHTIELDDGRRVATHLLPSGILVPEATVILGKDMVIHVGDLMTEIEEMTGVNGEKGIANIMVDQMATLNLDTHRALESIQNSWFDGGKGSTGRGIAQSYIDKTSRHPLLIRDLVRFDENKIREHYRYYQAEISGLGGDLKNVLVTKYKSKEKVPVGSEDEFVERLRQQTEKILPYIYDVNPFLRGAWSDLNNAFVFEKAQAIGLDQRWGVYPDTTASDCTFWGILSSTEGVINPMDIQYRNAVVKAPTYMTSVGIRQLVTVMNPEWAARIVEDYNERGASTGRTRGVFHPDAVQMRFFSEVGIVNRHILTHMDAVYSDIPILTCTAYEIGSRRSYYRPDQEHILKVKPVYVESPGWDSGIIQRAKTPADLEKNTTNYIEFFENELVTRVSMITTGPKRDQFIRLQ